MKLRYLLFPFLLFARQPGMDKPCVVILAALVGSVALWGILAAGAVKVLV
jgi:hypothetical protein